MRIHTFGAILFALTACGVGQASAILGTNLPTLNSAVSVGSCCFLSQSFTLDMAVDVTSIDLQVAGTGIDIATVWLTDQVGPGTSLPAVLAQMTQVFPDNGGAADGETITLSVNQTLAAGNYFLVMGSPSTALYSASGPRPGWLLSTSTILSSVGSVGVASDSCCLPGSSTNSAFGPGSTFVAPGFGSPFAFQLNANDIEPQLPEPASWISMASGIAVLLGARRLRHRS
jgi:hypothetical protein